MRHSEYNPSKTDRLRLYQIWIIPEETGITPVSYTHLDVYKRQTPGSVAGFSLALEKYGTMPLNKVIRPAIKLAEEGFIVNDALADDLKTYGSEVIPQHENSKAIFWKNGEPLKKGDRLVQKNLGKSLELIAEHGPDAFYKGAIAEMCIRDRSVLPGLVLDHHKI